MSKKRVKRKGSSPGRQPQRPFSAPDSLSQINRLTRQVRQVDQVIGDSVARIVSSLSEDEIEQFSLQLVHLPARYPSLRLPPRLADALGQAALQLPAPPSKSEGQEVFLALCDQVFGPRAHHLSRGQPGDGAYPA